jgi:hypothetical protein
MPGCCRCAHCLNEDDHPDRQAHRELRLLLATLNFEQRRLFAAFESNRLGRGGVKHFAEISGLCSPTIARGRRELADLVQGKAPVKKEQWPLGGRWRGHNKTTVSDDTWAAVTCLRDSRSGSYIRKKYGAPFPVGTF